MAQKIKEHKIEDTLIMMHPDNKGKREAIQEIYGVGS